MANRQSSGYGLKPVNTLGNTPATSGQSQYKIKRAHGTAIYNGEPVTLIVNAGSGTGGWVEGAAAGSTTLIIGVFNGCFYNASTTLKPTWSNYYPASTTPANSENITAFVNDNPFQEYQIALDAAISATADTVQAIYGQVCDTTASGESTAGRSNTTLDTTNDLAVSGQQWRILRSAEDPDNQDFNAAYANVIVVSNNKYQAYVVGV